MGERVRVVRHQGELLAAKSAGPDGASSLVAEAEVLHRVQAPGVVELAGMSEGDEPSLLTRWVGSRSLADLTVPVPPGTAAAICLAVAATVARLHRAGIVHGHLDPTHVLLDAAGRPVLCGFGGAGPIGAPERRPATDLVQGEPLPGSNPRRPVADVAGLGRLLEHLLGPPGSPEPGPRLARATRTSASQRRALRALAATATSPDPDARPSVTAFAHSLRRAVPEARLGDDHGASTVPTRGDRTTSPGPGRHARPTEHRDLGSRLRSAVPAVLVLIAVSAASYFGLSAWWAPARERAAVADTRSTPSTQSTKSAVSPSGTSTAAATATTTTTTASSSTTTTSPPAVVEHRGRRYAIGSPGDVVLVGPWRCDGQQLPVVLHPVDGTVSLFHDWAPDGGSIQAVTVATVPGADGLHPSSTAPGCADLVVTGSGRDLTTLTAEELR